jgi:hypothetical protein
VGEGGVDMDFKKLKDFFVPTEKRGSSAIEVLVITAVSIAAIIMIGLFLMAQIAVIVAPSVVALDANSEAAANSSIIALFTMFSTIVPIVAAVIVILLLAIALGVILIAVRPQGGGGSYGGGLTM